MVGDGSYLMLNSEIATSVMLGRKLIVVVLDNRGYGCINRLQQAVRRRAVQQPVRRLRAGRRRARRAIDFAAHAASLGALRREREDDSRAGGGARARARRRPHVRRSASTPIPAHTTDEGGWWWEVAVPEVSERAEVRAARAAVRGQERKAQKP